MLSRHLPEQTPVIGALLATAIRAARRTPPTEPPPTPGPEKTATVRPRSQGLIDDYVRWAGGNPAAYRGTVPAHLFPQWGFPLLASCLTDIPYDLVKVINAGCRIEVNAPIPAGEPLELSARLVSIDDDGRRAILVQELVTGTRSAPRAMVAQLFAHVPSPKAEKREGKPKDKPRVPSDARPIAQRRLPMRAGREFALLTGDINPVHWIPPYAKAAGFKSTILHGFGTLAIAVEALNKGVFAGDPSKLRRIDVRFTRPLLLPGAVEVLVGSANHVYVGTAVDGPCFLSGEFTHV
jgi:acyl dehydratase